MFNNIMGLFGKTTQKSPKDQCREWTGKLRKQGYLLDREVRKIETEELKIQKDLKAAAKKGDRDVCLILAKELIRSKKAKSRIQVAKSQINSISMIIQEQMATVKMAGSLQKSTEVMKSMQNLISVKNISATMQDLSREMMKTGIISEMMDEAVEEAIDEEPIDEEAQAEVDKIMSELNIATGEKIANAPSTAPAAAKQAQQEASTSKEAEAVEEPEDDEDMKKMQRRLEMLKS
jgi:charged multivesicular body protein 3